MKTQVGQLLQLIGLIAVPLAITAEIAHRATLGQSVVLSFLGALIFLIGTNLRESSAP